MPRASHIIGLRVLDGATLRPIGRVRELLLSRDGKRVCGLLLDRGGWLQPRRVLDYQAVQAVGDAHVLAAEQYLGPEAESRCCQELTGLPVLRGTGQEVGILDDLHFETATGRITGLQLSHGLVDDLLHGKDVVPLDGPLLAGEAAILLDGPGGEMGGPEDGSPDEVGGAFS